MKDDELDLDQLIEEESKKELDEIDKVLIEDEKVVDVGEQIEKLVK